MVPVFSIISNLGETVVTLLLDKDNESNHHIRVYTIASPAIRLPTTCGSGCYVTIPAPTIINICSVVEHYD